MRKDLGILLIKARSTNSGLWYSGEVAETISGKFCVVSGELLEEVLPETACVYTGYTDKRNIPIHDKDIIRLDGLDESYVVIYYDDEHIDVITLDEYRKGYELVSFDLSAVSDTCTVIGNLYD